MIIDIRAKFSDRSAEAQAAYARQAALYASQVSDVRPADDLFEQPTVPCTGNCDGSGTHPHMME